MLGNALFLGLARRSCGGIAVTSTSTKMRIGSLAKTCSGGGFSPQRPCVQGSANYPTAQSNGERWVQREADTFEPGLQSYTPAFHRFLAQANKEAREAEHVHVRHAASMLSAASSTAVAVDAMRAYACANACTSSAGNLQHVAAPTATLATTTSREASVTLVQATRTVIVRRGLIDVVV
jgi:hypothetical protein